MAAAAGVANKAMVLINPKLTDVQSAAGVGSVRGRQGRLDFARTFITAYHLRLLCGWTGRGAGQGAGQDKSGSTKLPPSPLHFNRLSIKRPVSRREHVAASACHASPALAPTMRHACSHIFFCVQTRG